MKTNKTEIEEAIEFVERYRYAKNSKFNMVIRLLKRGEKFEKMWEKLKKRGSELGLFMTEVPINLEGNLDKLMKEYEQKYFPKPSKDFTEKVMKKIEEVNK